jgi:hypothetical protein
MQKFLEKKKFFQKILENCQPPPPLIERKKLGSCTQKKETKNEMPIFLLIEQLIWLQRKENYKFISTPCDAVKKRQTE